MSSDLSLVVTDLDGTLWDREGTVHPRTLAAWEEVHARGIPLLVATGRRIASVREAFLALGWSVPAVMLDGAIGIDLTTEERFHSMPFPRVAAHEVLAAFRVAEVDPCLYVDGSPIEVYVSENPGTHPYHLEMLGSTVATADLDEVVETLPVLTFSLIGRSTERLMPVAERVRAIGQPLFNDSYTLDGGAFTVTARGSNKWTGVLAYCARMGIDSGRVVALGDGINDVELLENAALALSFEGAHPEAVARADHLLSPSHEGGWSELLGHLR